MTLPIQFVGKLCVCTLYEAFEPLLIICTHVRLVDAGPLPICLMNRHDAVSGVARHPVEIMIIQRFQNSRSRLQVVAAGCGCRFTGIFAMFDKGPANQVLCRTAASVGQFLDEGRLPAFGFVRLRSYVPNISGQTG